MLAPSRPWLLALALTACGDGGPAQQDAGSSGGADSSAATITITAPETSATGSSSGAGDDTTDTGADLGVPVAPVEIVIHSQRATRIDVYVYAAPTDAAEVLVRTLEHGEGDAFRTTLDPDDLVAAGVGDVLYYGLRAWGPNWPEDPRWLPGSEAGFVADVDDEGNRFNPNKLLVDPRARELSHDPIHADVRRRGGLSHRPRVPRARQRPVRAQVGARAGAAARCRARAPAHARAG